MQDLTLVPTIPGGEIRPVWNCRSLQHVGILAIIRLQRDQPAPLRLRTCCKAVPSWLPVTSFRDTSLGGDASPVLPSAVLAEAEIAWKLHLRGRGKRPPVDVVGA